MFSRATITLGIGPHSSNWTFFSVLIIVDYTVVNDSNCDFPVFFYSFVVMLPLTTNPQTKRTDLGCETTHVDCPHVRRHLILLLGMNSDTHFTIARKVES